MIAHLTASGLAELDRITAQHCPARVLPAWYRSELAAYTTPRDADSVSFVCFGLRHTVPASCFELVPSHACV